MRTFSFISLSITLALAFVLWLPNELSFPILWLSSILLPILLIADLAALVHLIRHRKEKAAKWLAGLVVAIPIAAAIGDCASPVCRIYHGNVITVCDRFFCRLLKRDADKEGAV